MQHCKLHSLNASFQTDDKIKKNHAEYVYMVRFELSISFTAANVNENNTGIGQPHYNDIPFAQMDEPTTHEVTHTQTQYNLSTSCNVIKVISQWLTHTCTNDVRKKTMKANYQNEKEQN